MERFLLYEFKTAVVLAVFYLFYRLLLGKETFHKVNRVLLLLTAALSLVLPLCVITVQRVIEMPTAPLLPPEVYGGDIAPAVQEINSTVQTTTQTSHEGTNNWLLITCVILAIGTLTVLAKTVISMVRTSAIIRHGRKEYVTSTHGNMSSKTQEVTVVKEDVTPFSWMRHIVMSEKDWAEGREEIILHEQAHISFGHSWDILFTDILTAFQWYNPTVWMLRADLRELHEYQADERVLKQGIDAKQYQYLLVKKAVGTISYSVANSFNHSTLKNRIMMMTRKRS